MDALRFEKLVKEFIMAYSKLNETRCREIAAEFKADAEEAAKGEDFVRVGGPDVMPLPDEKELDKQVRAFMADKGLYPSSPVPVPQPPTPASDDLAMELEEQFVDVKFPFDWKPVAAHVRKLIDDAVKEAKKSVHDQWCIDFGRRLQQEKGYLKEEIAKEHAAELSALKEAHDKELTAAKREGVLKLAKFLQENNGEFCPPSIVDRLIAALDGGAT